MMKKIIEYIVVPADCKYRVIVPWYPSAHPHCQTVCAINGSSCESGDRFTSQCPLEDAE